MSDDRVSALVAREAPALLAYFARRVSPIDDAADLVGETMLVIWRKRARLPADDTGARMWLYGIARRVLSTHRRGTARRVALADRLRLELREENVSRDVSGDFVRALIEQLPDIDREIVRLRHWEGFNIDEVASILAMSPGAVRTRYSRATARMRANLPSHEKSL